MIRRRWRRRIPDLHTVSSFVAQLYCVDHGWAGSGVATAGTDPDAVHKNDFAGDATGILSASLLKKEAKNFSPWIPGGRSGLLWINVFWFFFQKRTAAFGTLDAS
jgi:hypothetical protein